MEASAHDIGKPFRFFDLPRELRNLIYEAVGGNTGTAETWDFSLAGADISPCPIPRLLLVNIQFKTEYEGQKVFRDAKISIDLDTSALDSDEAHDPAVGIRIGLVPFTLNAHFESRVRSLKHVVIRIQGRKWHGFQEDKLENLIDDICKELPQITSVEVQFCDELEQFDRRVNAQTVELALLLPAVEPNNSPSCDRRVVVTRTLLLWGHLCGGVRTLGADAITATLGLGRALRCHRSNEVLYIATRTSAVPSWNGLDLRVVEGGDLDIDGIIAEVRAEREEARRRARS